MLKKTIIKNLELKNIHKTIKIKIKTILGPTPGNRTSLSNVSGISPSYCSFRIAAVCLMYLQKNNDICYYLLLFLFLKQKKRVLRCFTLTKSNFINTF